MKTVARLIAKLVRRYRLARKGIYIKTFTHTGASRYVF